MVFQIRSLNCIISVFPEFLRKCHKWNAENPGLKRFSNIWWSICHGSSNLFFNLCHHCLIFFFFFGVNVIKQMQKTNDQRNVHIKWWYRDKNNNSCFTKQDKNNSLYNTKVPQKKIEWDQMLHKIKLSSS